MKDIGLRISLMGEENKPFKMALYMRVNLEMDSNVAMVVITGSISLVIKEIGKIIKCMVKVFCIMKMVEYTLGNSNQIKNMVLVFINGPTAKFMMETG